MSLSEAKLLADLRQRFFSPSHSTSPLTIGIELELIPIFRQTKLPALPRSGTATSTSAILSHLGKREGWTEESVADDPASWRLTSGARISFEPGGQIEISSAPGPAASAVITEIQNVASLIRTAMRDAGVDLLSQGVDPFNDIEAVPLQLHRARYERMTRFFESIGPSGVRMMRQTAAVQINIERGPDPLRRWALLNALAPYIVALFANSPNYAGHETEHASYRAHLWRTLDPSRTGLPYNADDPAKRYLDFALDAKAIATIADGGGPRSFREWIRDGNPSEVEWAFHLSTLFPEIRPKEFFEIRSADAIQPDLVAAVVVFVGGLVYHPQAAARASALVGEPSEKLLIRGGKDGVGDPDIRKTLPALIEIALDGAIALGAEYLSPDNVQVAREFFVRALQPVANTKA